MTKMQWRMLMSNILDIHNDADAHQERATKQSAGVLDAILESRNDASAAHAFIENRLEDLRQQLRAIERRLPPETVALEAVSSDDGQQPLPTAIDYGAMRWRTQNEDGTWRDCID
jgi:hypothetical protein